MPQLSFRLCSAPALVGLALILGVALLHAQAPAASGTITVDTTKVEVRTAAAVGYQAPNGRLVSVLVSDKAADRKEFVERTTVGAGEPLVAGIVEGAWKGLHLEKALSGFVFTINSDRRILSNEFLVGDAFSIDADELVLELTSLSPRLTGRIRTKQPTLDLGSLKVSLDLTFDVLVGAPGK